MFNISSTYVGKDSKQFISPAVLAGRTLAVPTVTIKRNVNWKTRITKVDMSGLVKAASCSFDPAGTVNIDELWLTVKNLEVNLELCKNDLYQDFIGTDMGTNDPIPADFMAFLIGEIGANVADDIETKVWRGVDGVNSFDGFETLLGASANPKVSVPVALDASNVIAEIRRGVDLAPDEILGRQDLFIYVGSKVYQSIKEANNDKNAASPCGEDCTALDGITVQLSPGMNADAYIIAQKSNLFFGTWENSDLSSIKVKDMSEFIEDNVRFGMKFFCGTAIAYYAEVVSYGI